MATIRGDKVSAVDLSEVVMVNSNQPEEKKKFLSQEGGHSLSIPGPVYFIEWPLDKPTSLYNISTSNVAGGCIILR